MDQRNVSDCSGCHNTQVLFYLTEIPCDHKFLSDVTGCRKTQVLDCTVVIFFRNSITLISLLICSSNHMQDS
jgi:hypothetical protein